ncbi:GSU2403 family nucleotidyltransferase fold protein [Roseibium salinum]|nr:GSU2403 family nucleotidyltransferase fold protein [Roseibium salinum]
MRSSANDRPRKKTWRWRQTNRQALVEFLTPSFEQDEAIRDLPALGVNAQSLHFSQLSHCRADTRPIPLSVGSACTDPTAGTICGA